mgnify:CR=1 FL=1
MLKLVLIALEILKRIQQSRGTIKVSLTYQSQCSGITYQDALNLLLPFFCQTHASENETISAFSDGCI